MLGKAVNTCYKRYSLFSVIEASVTFSETEPVLQMFQAVQAKLQSSGLILKW